MTEKSLIKPASRSLSPPFKPKRSFGTGRFWPVEGDIHREQPLSTTALQGVCPYKMGTTFCSTMTGQTFRVKATADCHTRNVVYLIERKKCAVQYAGETENALCVRLTGHRSDINHNWIDRTVAKYFSQPDHSIHDLTIMVIEKIHWDDSHHRKRKENHWIELLWSLTPYGLNVNS